MATPRPDDELLYRGGELLSAGNPTDARPFLERALQMQPQNEKAQNLLGLTYFKLGVLDRAAMLYEQLVRDNSTDPTLRVNLGLVYLKMQHLGEAVAEFETAIDLAPDHAKAHNYLGLALAQAGDYARARDHFYLAGSEAMVEKMDQALAAAPPESVGDPVAESLPPPVPPDSVSSAPINLEAFPSSVQSQEAHVQPVPQLDHEPPMTWSTTPEQPFDTSLQQLAEPPAEMDIAVDELVGGDDDLRFAEDEGPSAPPMPPAGAAPTSPSFTGRQITPVEPSPLVSAVAAAGASVEREKVAVAPLMVHEQPTLAREDRTSIFGLRVADLMRQSQAEQAEKGAASANAPVVTTEPTTDPGLQLSELRAAAKELKAGRRGAFKPASQRGDFCLPRAASHGSAHRPDPDGALA